MITDIEALVILTEIPHLGPMKIRSLIERFGSAAEALEMDPSAIAALPGFGQKVMEKWGYWKRDNAWKKNLELTEKHEAAIISYANLQFPKRLLEIPDCPTLLYVKGSIEKVDQRCIAIVGTRQASIYGMEMAEKIASELASAGFTIVSGLARGIDTAAHVGALRSGRTIAVIGSGLADIYPAENKGLAQMISKKGALVSEFPMMTPPDRQNFPQRNRIVSGMTLGTLLIEAPIKSGAMLTMERAFSQKRRLFALPGRADSENFKGNHLLIKSGRAQLIESANDIVDHFETLFSGLPPQITTRQPEKRLDLGKEESDFLELLPNQELSIDEIMNYAKLPVNKVNVLIMSLMLKRAIKEFPGKIYKKI